MIPIYKPYISKYKESAIKAIQDEWISNHGIYITLATNKLKEILNVKHCILMNNGTSSTHCLFKALKFKYPHINKIYVPNNVFVAPWNCALMEYDEKILEVMKIDHVSLNIDVSEDYIASLDANSAVVIVHNLGNIINVPRLKRLRPDLVFIEDNCEGLFGKYEGQFSGTSEASLCSAVSFYGNKTITTGEGGAFFTNDDDVYAYIKTLHSHGMTSVRYVHNVTATNFRMTNVQAGFLYDQLNDIDHILGLKAQITKNYIEMLSDVKGVKFIKTEDNTINSKWMFVILLDDKYKFTDFEDFMRTNGVEVRGLFYDVRRHDHLRNINVPYHDDFTVDLTNHGSMLPSYPELTYDEQLYVCNKIRVFCADSS